MQRDASALHEPRYECSAGIAIKTSLKTFYGKRAFWRAFCT
jgi:hypothetical protein